MQGVFIVHSLLMQQLTICVTICNVDGLIRDILYIHYLSQGGTNHGGKCKNRQIYS